MGTYGGVGVIGVGWFLENATPLGRGGWDSKYQHPPIGVLGCGTPYLKGGTRGLVLISSSNLFVLCLFLHLNLYFKLFSFFQWLAPLVTPLQVVVRTYYI